MYDRVLQRRMFANGGMANAQPPMMQPRRLVGLRPDLIYVRSIVEQVRIVPGHIMVEDARAVKTTVF